MNSGNMKDAFEEHKAPRRGAASATAPGRLGSSRGAASTEPQRDAASAAAPGHSGPVRGTSPTAAPRRHGLLRRLGIASAAVALLLALAGCTGVEAALPGSTPNIDVEAICAQAFEEQPDGFEVLADGAAAVMDENGGEPSFTDEDTAYAESNLGFESYSELDALGRCGTATACLGPETMPADDEERESISEIKPSGWDQAFYDSIRDGALWNRCHLIAWSLSAENANERNLVTGTRSMNAESMLPYEEEVARYIDRTGNHVLYRATPVFEGQELVCRGILIEAESLEDDGRGVSFSVFCVNVQPGVAIDYDTGDSHVEQEEASEPAEAREYVLNASSMRFHLPECESVADMAPGNRVYVTESRDDLIREGYEPCGSCQP